MQIFLITTTFGRLELNAQLNKYHRNKLELPDKTINLQKLFPMDFNLKECSDNLTIYIYDGVIPIITVEYKNKEGVDLIKYGRISDIKPGKTVEVFVDKI